MIDVITVSTLLDRSGGAACAEPALVESLLPSLREESPRGVRFHVNREVEAARLAALVDALQGLPCRIEVYADDLPSEGLAALVEERKLPLILQADALARDTCAGLDGMSRVADLSLFLPLPRPCGAEAVRPLAEAGPDIRRVIVGAGWTGRYSGPRPVPGEERPAWAAGLVEVTQALSERRVEIVFACGWPLCVFSRDDLGKLAGTRVRWPLARCWPQVAVEPDGRLRYCPLWRGPAPAGLGDLRSIPAWRDTCEAWLAPYRGLCLEREEGACRSLATGACAGGCPVHCASGWKGAATGP